MNPPSDNTTANAASPARNLRRRRNTSLSSSSSVVAEAEVARHSNHQQQQRDPSPARRATRKRKTSLTSALALGVKRAIKASRQSEASSSRTPPSSNAAASDSVTRSSKREPKSRRMRDQLKSLAASGRGLSRSSVREQQVQDVMDVDESTTTNNEADEVAGMLGVHEQGVIHTRITSPTSRRLTQQSIVEDASSSSSSTSNTPSPPPPTTTSSFLTPRTPSPASDPLLAERRAVRAHLVEALNAAPPPSPPPPPPMQRNNPATQPSSASRIDQLPPPHPLRNGLPPEPSPTMVALLRDVLGLRGRANGPPGAAPSESGPPIPGTTVIVQGALVSRTLAPRSAVPATTGNQAHADEPMPPAVASSAAAESAATPSGVGGDGNAEPGQAATLEDQAEMLSRLLSIAAAATAASLVAGPNARRAADSFNNDATNALRRSTTSRTASSSTVASTQAANPTNSSAQTSAIGALRERLSALTDRLRAPRAAPAAPPTTDSAPLATAEAAAPPVAQDGTVNSTTGPLSSLGHMLRDALAGFGTAPRNSAPSPSDESASTSANAESTSGEDQLQGTNAILERVREGNVIRGEDGSFDRFIFDLGHDLSAAVQSLTSFLPPEAVAAAHAAQRSAQQLDAATQARRESDVRGGRLAFFRLFSFAPVARPEASVNDEPLLARSSNARRASESDASGAAFSSANSSSTRPRTRASYAQAQLQPQPRPEHTHLVPCVIVGVRSLAPADVGGALFGDEAPGSEYAPGAVRADPNPGNAAATADAAIEGDGSGEEVDEAGDQGAAVNDGRNVARYLLFVSGGQYEPDHPLLTSPSREAGQDLMQLMEFLSRMAQYKPAPPTVTQAEIEAAGLQRIKGKACDIAACVTAGSVMENTAQRCLICLEDWDIEVEQDCRLLTCKHLYHTSCIDRWLTARNACPLCRAEAVKKAPPAPHPQGPVQQV